MKSLRNLQQENKQLKEKNKEQSLLLIEFQQMEYERDLYKNVIDEVRNVIEEDCTIELGQVSEYGDNLNPRKLLEILDKVKESE